MDKPDYTGKNIYVGIDVHKRFYVCAVVCDGIIVKKDTLVASPTILIDYISRHFAGAHVETAYEASFSGFHLHRHLITAGIQSHVINPTVIPMVIYPRIKSDKRDAQRIAIELSAGRLKDVRIPTLEQESYRSTSRLRNHYVKWRHQAGQNFKALLFTQGLIAPEDQTVLSRKWVLKKIKEARASQYPAAYTHTLGCYAQIWLYFTDLLKELDKEFRNMQGPADKELLAIYQSFPGISATIAITLKNELGDMSDFSNARKLFRYLGLVPLERTSGERRRDELSHHEGHTPLRQLLIEAAYVVIKKDVALKEVYKRIDTRRGGKRAIVAVARRLVGKMRACIIYNKK